MFSPILPMVWILRLELQLFLKIAGEIMGLVEISVIVYLSVLGFVAYKSRKKTLEELKK